MLIRGRPDLPEWTGAEDQPLQVQTLHQHAHAAVRLAEHIDRGHEDVLEDQLAGVGAAHAQLVELAGDGEARGGGVYDEGRDALGAQLRLRLGVHDDDVRVGSLQRLRYWACSFRTDGGLGRGGMCWIVRWDERTLVIHILVPLSTNPPSTFRAVVFMLTTSEPAECSDMASAPTLSPEISGGRKRSFCFAVPFRESWLMHSWEWAA